MVTLAGEDECIWTPTTSKKLGVAIYTYVPSDDVEFAIPLEIGESVKISEECNGWFYGTVVGKNRKGIFPSTYVHLKQHVIDNQGPYETIVSFEDPTVQEAALVLREWWSLWKRLYLNCQETFTPLLKRCMLELIAFRRELLQGSVTLDRTKELRGKITAKIDWGNEKLGIDLVPRINNEVVDCDSISLVHLYNIHVQTAETSKQSRYTAYAELEHEASVGRHMYLLVRSLELSGLVENTELELQFSVYDAALGIYIHELFCVQYQASPVTSSVSRKDSNTITHVKIVQSSAHNSALFTSLDTEDPHGQLFKDLYLVVKIFRTGKMILMDPPGTRKPSFASSSSQNSNGGAVYRRPYSCGVLGLSSFMMGLTSHTEDQVIRLNTCVDNEFYCLHDNIVKKLNSKYNVLANAGVVVSLQLLKGSVTNAKEQNSFLPKSVIMLERFDSGVVLKPGDTRNELQISVIRAEFEKAGKAVGKNIEVIMQLVDENGIPIKCTFGSGIGTEPKNDWNSFVIYHNNCPRWGETLKIHLPLDYSMEKLCKTYVFMQYRHCSTKDKSGEKKTFAYSFIPIVDKDGTAILDGAYALSVFKVDESSKTVSDNTKLTEQTRKSKKWFSESLKMSEMQIQQSHTVTHKDQSSSVVRDVVFITTRLCSSKLTQNKDLLVLLKWRSHPDYTRDALEKMTVLPATEVFRFLHHIFDTLFCLFTTDEGNTTSNSHLVFDVLVHIFSLLDQPQYASFIPVTKSYIEKHFAAALSYSAFFRVIRQSAEVVNSTENPEILSRWVRSFQCLDWIFRLIVQSRILHVRTIGTVREAEFLKDVRSCFCIFADILAYPYAHLQRIQLALLSKLAMASEILVPTVPTLFISELLGNILNGMQTLLPYNDVNHAKLQFIQAVADARVFEEHDCRKFLLQHIVLHLSAHMTEYDNDLIVCAKILESILNVLHDEYRLQGPTKRDSFGCDVLLLVEHVLQPLVACVLSLDRQNSLTGKLVSCLFALLKIMSPQHYNSLIDNLLSCGSKKKLKDFLFRLFLVFRDMVCSVRPICESEKDGGKQKGRMDTLERMRIRYGSDAANRKCLKEINEIFPSTWSTMRFAVNYVILNAMQEFDEVLQRNFLLGDNFDFQLWSTYFQLCVSFLTQPSLQLEQSSENKRVKILEKYQDMREIMALQINVLWANLNDRKSSFTPSLVGPILEMSLIPQMEVRKATIPIFYEMLDTEFTHRGSIKMVEADFIDKFDILVSEGKGDLDYCCLFEKKMMNLLNERNPEWSDHGSVFVGCVCNLLEKLLDYRSVTSGDHNKYKRMSCTLNLLEFYRSEVNREELYTRYVYKLHDLLISSQYFVEAASVLLRHADLLGWKNRTLHADLRYPVQCEWQRKEQIYEKVLSYYDKGKCWERGVPLLKELCNFYERNYDYQKLTQLLRKEADFYEKMMFSIDRFEPEYFRVGFFGQAFPAFVKNKVFVYRGHIFEKISTFANRIHAEWPGAASLSQTLNIDDSVKLSTGQAIQINKVSPVPTLKDESELIPEHARTYFESNEIRMFEHKRPLGEVKKRSVVQSDSGENDAVKNLWSERTLISTRDILPGILCWSEVIEQRCEIISPAQNACNDVTDKNIELRLRTQELNLDAQRYRQGLVQKPPNAQSLLRVLQGTIIAAVNGGLAKYQNAFFALPFGLEDQQVAINQLKLLICEKFELIDKALQTSAMYILPDCKPLQDDLGIKFQKMRRDFFKAVGGGASPLVRHRLSTGKLSSSNSDEHGSDSPRLKHRLSGSIVHSPLPPLPNRRSSSILSSNAAMMAHQNGTGGGSRSSGTNLQFPIAEQENGEMENGIQESGQENGTRDSGMENIYSSLNTVSQDYDYIYESSPTPSPKPPLSYQSTSGYCTPQPVTTGLRPRSEFVSRLSSGEEPNSMNQSTNSEPALSCERLSHARTSASPGKVRKFIVASAINAFSRSAGSASQNNESNCGKVKPNNEASLSARLPRKAESPSNTLSRIRTRMPSVGKSKKKSPSPPSSQSVNFCQNNDRESGHWNASFDIDYANHYSARLSNPTSDYATIVKASPILRARFSETSTTSSSNNNADYDFPDLYVRTSQSIDTAFVENETVCNQRGAVEGEKYVNGMHDDQQNELSPQKRRRGPTPPRRPKLPIKFPSVLPSDVDEPVYAVPLSPLENKMLIK